MVRGRLRKDDGGKMSNQTTLGFKGTLFLAADIRMKDIETMLDKAA